MRLEGKVAIITGSGRGLGKEAAFLFAEEGAKVVVGDINYESAEEVAAAIGEKGGEAMAVKLDVTDSASIQAMVDAVMERFGSIDVLVNNAGITADAQLVKMNEDQWDRVIAVNLKGVYQLHQSDSPHHDRQGFRQESSIHLQWWAYTATSARPTTLPPRPASSA
jgi:3-oxoacyl-[acyl-carrier protein] reductase